MQSISKNQSCIAPVLSILLAIWIIAITVFTQISTWFTQQALIMGGQTLPLWIFPLTSLTQAFLILTPLLPLALRWRESRYRSIFKTWALSTIFVIFLIPMRFVPNNEAQTANLIQIIGISANILFLSILIRRRSVLATPKGNILPALFLAPIIIYAWFAYGALGSITDSILNLVAALLFGISAGLLFTNYLLTPLNQQDNGKTIREQIVNFLSQGFIMGISFLIMGSSFGFNGIHLFLSLLLPPLGWLLWIIWKFSHEGDGAQPQIQIGWLTIGLFVGIVISAPLMFIDPDELTLMLNLGGKDILYWSNQATQITILTTMILGIAFYIISSFFRKINNIKSILLAGAVFTWLLGGWIYFSAGKPGFYGEHLFVILKNRADVSGASQIKDFNQRRQFVYKSLIETANRSQEKLRTQFNQLGLHYTPYYLVNAIEIDADFPVRFWLSSQPEVEKILEIPVLRPIPPIASSFQEKQESIPQKPDWNLTTIGATKVWQEFGITGEGIIIGQSDSGVQGDHPELRDNYRGNRVDSKVKGDDYNWLDPWNKTLRPTETEGHGTHTLGSIIGKNVGVAPGAQWYGCVNLARNLGNPARYLDCMQFMLAPYPLNGNPLTDGKPEYGAHISNNSWGCPDIEGCQADTLLSGAKALRAAGVFVVVSAGNDGDRCETIKDPIAIYDEVFTVGAVDSSGKVAFFSSRGPVTVDGSSRIKPNIVAPGVSVLSAFPKNSYANLDGTSMAGPHVAGVAALMWSANPNLIGDIETTTKILEETATPYNYQISSCAGDNKNPNNVVGFGIVNAYEAVKRAIDIKPE